MHPFDHDPTRTEVITGSWDDWSNSINQNYLAVCENKTVLEIACWNGDISRRIVEHNPKFLTLLDPGIDKSPLMESASIKFVKDDVHHWLPTASPVQVVICFGLLYHLHSPLYFLELLVNYSDPETIILDNVVAPHPLAFNIETNNMPGQRQVRKDWKYCPFNMPTPFFIINQRLDHMGYQLDKSHHLKCEPFPKSNSWVASWTKR